MKSMKQMAVVALVFFGWHLAADAVTGLGLSIQSNDVVLLWPSSESQRYVVRYRETLDVQTPWTVLDSGFPAAAGTNRTVFIHAGAFQVPPAGEGGGGGEGGGALPLPGANNAALAVADETSAFPLDSSVITFLASRKMFPPFPWDRQHRSPHIWELEGRPPLPWDPDALILAPKLSGTIQSLALFFEEGDSPSPMPNESLASSGFYSVEPWVGGSIGLVPGQSVQRAVDVPTVAFTAGSNRVQEVMLLLDEEVIDSIGSADGVTNHTFVIDTRLFRTGNHTLRLALHDDSGSADDGVGDIDVLTDPVTVAFDNPLYGIDWTGVVERRLVASFGTTVADGQVHILLTDNLGRTWFDDTRNLADIRQPDGRFTIADPSESYYSGVTDFQFSVTIIPAALAGGGPAPSPITELFHLGVFQRNPGDFGYYMTINQQTGFNPNTQAIFDLSAENFLLAGQTIWYTVNLDGEIDPFQPDTIYPRNDLFRHDFTRVRDSIVSNPVTLDHPNGVTMFSYLGHAGKRFIGWGPGRPVNDVRRYQNMTAEDILAFTSPNRSGAGVVNYACIVGCWSASGSMMRTLVGTTAGRSYQYYQQRGLWPKFGIGLTNGGWLDNLLLQEPRPAVFNFINEWHSQAYLNRNGQGYPTKTFRQAFTDAANTGASHAEGSLVFGLVGCTNCFIDEVLTGSLRTVAGAGGQFAPASSGGSTMQFISTEQCTFTNHARLIEPGEIFLPVVVEDR